MQLLFVLLSSISFWVGLATAFFVKKPGVPISFFIAFVILGIISEIMGKRAKKKAEKEEENE